MISKTKWLLWIAVVLVVMLVAPFAVLFVDPTEVAALLLTSHYDSLILGVLTVAIAIAALNTYLGIEDRVDQRMIKVVEEMKNTNKEYLKIMTKLQDSRDDANKFHSVVSDIVKDAEVYRFFAEEIKDVSTGRYCNSRSHCPAYEIRDA